VGDVGRAARGREAQQGQSGQQAGTEAARVEAYRALSAIVSWLQVPLDDPSWRPGR